MSSDQQILEALQLSRQYLEVETGKEFSKVHENSSLKDHEQDTPTAESKSELSPKENEIEEEGSDKNVSS